MGSPGTARPRPELTRPVLAALLAAGLAGPAGAVIDPGRVAVLDAFADPFDAGHAGALFAADPASDPSANATALSSSAELYEALDLAFLPDGRVVVVDREADPSGFGPDANDGVGAGAVFVAAAQDQALSLLADGSVYPAGLPPSMPTIFVDPQGLAVDAGGLILVADRDADPSGLGPDGSGFAGHGAVFAVDPASGAVTLVADGSVSADGQPPAGAPSWFEDPGDVVVTPQGRLFVLDTYGDPSGVGASGAVYEVDPSLGEVRLVATSALLVAPVSLAALSDGRLVLSDQLADPDSDGSRGALFLVDPAAADPEAALDVLVTDPRFRSVGGLSRAGDDSVFVADTFADPLAASRLGAVFRVRPGGRVEVVSSDVAYRALSSVAVAPPSASPPTLSRVRPGFAEQGDVLTLQLDGTSFQDGAEVSLGADVTVTAVRRPSSALLEADVDVAADAPPGLRDVRVINPDFQAADLAGGFEVIALPRPVLDGVAPASGAQGTQLLGVAVTGRNFADGASLDLGAGIAVDTVRFVDSGRLEADLAIDAGAPLGARDVTVTNPDLLSGTLTAGFTVTEPGPPRPTLVEPTTLERGAPVTLTITGTGFQPGMSASFDADIAVGPVTVRGPTQATCLAVAALAAPTGSRDLTLANPDGQAGDLPDAVAVPDRPVLRVTAFVIADEGGDGEGDLDPGETAGLDVTLHDPTPVEALSVGLRLVNPFPGLGLTVVRSTVTFPNVPAGGTARRAGPPFPEVAIDPDVACGTEFPLDVELLAGGEVVGRQRIELPVGRAATWVRKPIIEGVQAGGRRGAALALADVDGDGVADLLVGAPREDAADGTFSVGRVIATSGTSDDPLWTVEGDEVSGLFGSAVSDVGDLDGDGATDVAVGAPGELAGAGRVHLLSGRDGSALGTVDGEAGWALGTATVLVGDRDLDGEVELALGAPGATAGDGLVLIVGPDLAERDRLSGRPAERLGEALAPLGDADGDGLADLAIGAPGGEGAVVRWLGSGVVAATPGPVPGEAFGAALAAGPDADGDGVSDLVVGAPLAGPGGAAEAGRALLLSGRTGSVLREFSGTAAGQELGRSVGVLDDVDGDGVPEVALGIPGAFGDDGSIEIRSGANGSLLFFSDGAAGSGGRLGESLAAGPDAGGDPFPDLLVGAPRAITTSAPLAGRAVALKSELACEPFAPCEPDGFEPNDDVPEATVLGYALVDGLGICRSDVDVFELVPPPDRRMLVRVIFSHADGDLDATLHDESDILLDASLSLDDDEELGPFGPGGGTFRVRIFGFERASNTYSLQVLDPDSCPPVDEVRGLLVRKGGDGQLVLSWEASTDPCHRQAAGAPAYAVYASATPEPSGGGGFPAGTAFADVTLDALDGDLTDRFHVEQDPGGPRYYLVADIGRAGEVGPVGHYE